MDKGDYRCIISHSGRPWWLSNLTTKKAGK